MKTLVLAFYCFLFAVSNGQAQESLAFVAPKSLLTAVSNGDAASETNLRPDSEPAFEGGYTALSQFINTHLTYPEIARMNGAEGKAAVRFLVNEKGTATRIKVLHSPGYDCDKSLIKLIEQMPTWSPAFRNGQVQGGWVLLEVAFRLQ
jgi:TonB family protein